MNRRRMMRTAGLAVTLPLAGCLNAGRFFDEHATPERPWAPSPVRGTPAGAHDLYVVNLTESRLAGWIRVVRDDTASIVNGRYDLPATGGLEFTDIGAWETTYTIEVAFDARTRISQYWSTAMCGADTLAPGETGSRNAILRILTASDASDGERASLVTDQCDQLHKPAVPTGPAEGYRLDD